MNRALPAGEVLAAALDWARAVANEVSPASAAVAKAQLYADLHGDVGTAVATSERLLDETIAGDDYREGVAAWLGRRPPAFADLPAGPGAGAVTTPVERPRLVDSKTAWLFLVVAGVVAVMWVAEVIDLLPHTPFDSWGIRPRQMGGLPGIVFAPFLHAGFGHLIGNTIPFLVMGCVIATAGVQRFVQVTVIVGLIAGLGTWLVGPAHTVHIGASGLVFGYLSYLVTRGLFEHKVGHIVVGLLVLFFYGGILWGLLPRPGISWQGHLFGLIGGVVAAWVIHGRGSAPPDPAP